MAISITRGDTPSFSIEILDTAGRPYELQEGDKLTFSVKRSVKVTDPILLQKVMDSSTGPHFHLTQSDTSLAYGSYVYDVELATADGYVCTVVKPDSLTVTAEVTTHGS